ncbi:MAG: hypothetical protein KGL39_35770 [Patescibacteria group bacterium]|nr:hypothetical protein [Patescibacteria group bacterium]
MSNALPVEPPGVLPPGLSPQFDDQLPANWRNPDGSFKSDQQPQTWPAAPPNGRGTLTTAQCAPLVPKQIG